MSVESILMTAEEFELRDDDWPRYELLEGALVEMSPNLEHSMITGNISELLRGFVKPRRLGLASVECSFLVRRNPDTILIPDIYFIRQERLPAPKSRNQLLELVPDLVVEVISPSDRWGDVNEKVRMYLDVGVAMVVVVWPKQRQLLVHLPNGDVVTLNRDDTFDGREVIPGLRISVREIFE